MQAGDEVPAVTLYAATPGDKVDLKEYVGNKTVVMFGVPGAFTPGCSKVLMPFPLSVDHAWTLAAFMLLASCM